VIAKILIANRGEIAVRVIRACRELGICSVAVYSEVDRRALHVRMADEAVPIGPAPARDSYLRGERIIEAAKERSADAVHPGYGFLSENAEFARAVVEAGLIWIGPPPEAIAAMGSKTEARRIMMEAGVPVVPGDRSRLESIEEALASARRIGYPVLIKAAYGGGGKGMRIVKREEELPAAYEAAGREAGSAFGHPDVYLERYIPAPRHIEVQIFADHHGNVVHLYERECSIQRRHQKVIEESPSPVLIAEPGLRERMTIAAVAAATACGYIGAGTVEFLFDPASGEFYFLEMNTRLQVEHPVTELVTGLDLVHLQIAVASGEPLPFKQEDVSQTGHAIECRISAEDPSAGFLPDTGRIVHLREPVGPGVRVDSGVSQGDEIGLYYDPLMAKLIVWGADRKRAIARLGRALAEYRIAGVGTTIPFALWLTGNEEFQSGIYDTGFIGREYRPKEMRREDDDRIVEAAAIVAALQVPANGDAVHPGVPSQDGRMPVSNWKRAGRLESRG